MRRRRGKAPSKASVQRRERAQYLRDCVYAMVYCAATRAWVMRDPLRYLFPGGGRS